MPIHFGTDGWRAVISDTFTFSNLRMVAQAIADAVGSGAWLNGNLSASSIDSHRVVVGFDTRFLSDRYAKSRTGAGCQWIYRVFGAGGCSHPGNFACSQIYERHCRYHDYCIA